MLPVVATYNPFLQVSIFLLRGRAYNAFSQYKFEWQKMGSIYSWRIWAQETALAIRYPRYVVFSALDCSVTKSLEHQGKNGPQAPWRSQAVFDDGTDVLVKENDLMSMCNRKCRESSRYRKYSHHVLYSLELSVQNVMKCLNNMNEEKENQKFKSDTFLSPSFSPSNRVYESTLSIKWVNIFPFFTHLLENLRGVSGMCESPVLWAITICSKDSRY